MALFQPSNITPSSFAGVGGGTVASADKMKVSWQVNGNSPMTAYRIQVYLRNADGTTTSKFDTPITNKDIPVGGFYPTDNKGNPQIFTYESVYKWNKAVTDGNDYQLKITQYWGTPTKENPLEYPESQAVVQFSESAFIARTAPTLTLSVGNVAQVSQEVTAAYSQAQGDAISWVRWQFAEVEVDKTPNVYTVLDDTGEVDTAQCKYLMDGMQSGKRYAVKCTVQTENGVEVTTNGGDWTEFDVSYTIPSIDQTFSCNGKNPYYNELTYTNYDATTSIMGEDTPANSITFNGNGAVIPSGASVLWNKQKANKTVTPLSFNAPYTLAWKGGVKLENSVTVTNPSLTNQNGGVMDVSFSKNGRYFAVSFYNYDTQKSTINIYSTLNGQTTFIGSVNPNYLAGGLVSYGQFSPNADYFVFGGDGLKTYGCKISDYATPQDWTFTEISNAQSTFTTYSVAFSGNSSRIVLASYTGLYLFEVSDGAYTLKSQKTDMGVGVINKVAWGNQNAAVVACGAKGCVYLNASGDDIGSWATTKLTYNGTALSGMFYDVAFPTAAPYSYFVVAGNNNGVYRYSIYSNGAVEGEKIGVGGNALAESAVAYSKDGTACLIGNNIIGTFNGLNSVAISKVNNDLKDKIVHIAVSDESIVYASTTGGYVKNYVTQALTNVPLLSVNQGEIGLKVMLNRLFISLDGEDKIGLVITDKAIPFAVKVTSTTVVTPAYFVATVKQKASGELSFSATTESATQSHTEPNHTPTAITSLQIGGAQTNQWLYVQNGVAENIPFNYVPSWDNNDTQFLANYAFNNLEAGHITATYDADFYRKNVTTGEYSKLIARVPSRVTQLRDFGWLPYNAYKYEDFVRVSTASGAEHYTSSESTATPVCKNQPFYLLIEARQDETQPDVFHVVKCWRFGNNISAGSISNNNTPNWLTNFTGYRLKQPSSRKGKSGSLQALLSNVKNSDYNDTAAQMDELFEASNSLNDFFLKDMKGNLYKVAIANPITQTISTKTGKQEVTISLAWEETGSAVGVAIIQLPTDDGWDNPVRN